MEEYLTAREVGVRLALTTSRVYQLVRDGGLPSLKVGVARVFPRAAFEAWLARRERLAGTQEDG